MKVIFHLLFGLALSTALVGCSNDQEEAKKVNDKLATDIKGLQENPVLTEMVRKSGGDWNRLTPEDRQQLADAITKGNQAGAQMVFISAAAKAQGK